jgi:proline iminopeptidase
MHEKQAPGTMTRRTVFKVNPASLFHQNPAQADLLKNYSAIPLFVLMCLAAVPTSASAQTPVQAPTPLTRDTVAGYIADNQRITTPNGIEESIPVKINGITQWLLIRGSDKRNPVLLYLHGGPGTPFMPLAWT